MKLPVSLSREGILGRGKEDGKWRWAEGGASRRVGGLPPSVTYEDPITSRLLDFSFMRGADRHSAAASLMKEMSARTTFLPLVVGVCYILCLLVCKCVVISR